VQGLGFRVWSFEFRVIDLRFKGFSVKIQCEGFRIKGLEFRV
jgi:hypothetical protein